ncbi:MAG TPA: glycosyltransferase family 87 protein [Candidatus Kapabacteria bacterium]|nr:glycosyltransferase family 87 protein [Candidatus Kapabacteria bacterium]
MNDSPSTHARRDRIVLSIGAGVLLLLLVQTIEKAYRPQGYDFTSYLLATKAFWHGENPYLTLTSFPFIYPLVVCVLLYPIAMLPYAASIVLWFALSVAALAYTFYLLLGKQPLVLLNGVLSSLLLIGVLQNNLLNGQINLIVLALTAGFFAGLRRGATTRATMLLTLAIAIKLTPAIFIVYLLVRRAWGALALTLVFLAALFAVPILVSGGIAWNWYAWYATHFLFSQTSNPGFDAHWFSLTAWAASIASTPEARLIGMAVIVALVVTVVVWFQMRFRDVKSQPVSPAVFALYLLASLLLSPISEPHHLAFAIPAVSLLIGKLNLADGNSLSATWNVIKRNSHLRMRWASLITAALLILFARSVPGGSLCAVMVLLFSVGFSDERRLSDRESLPVT